MDSLGGYRLVRKLGDGARAEVFLAHPHRVADDAVPAAIKVFRGDVTNASISVEVEALSRGTGKHTLELLDLTTAPNGAPALILARCASGSVGRLIRMRPELRLGEAITILAPLAAAVGRLHAAGVTHGSIRPDAVLFDAAHTPTLACFGSSRLFLPGMSSAGRDAEPAFSVDLGSMKQLAVTILDRVRDDATAVTVEWLRASEPTHDDWLDTLGERLFAMGEPCAVSLDPHIDPPSPVLPSRLLRAEPVVSAQAVTIVAGLAVPDFVARMLPPQFMEAGAVAKVRGALSRVRPRFWVAAGSVVAALLAAVVLVPQGPSEAVSSAQGSASPASPQPETASATRGDDPVAAAVELLAARNRCIQSMSVLCLDGVVQPDSAAAAADRVLVRDIQDGSEPPTAWRFSPDDVAVIERLGDSALVSLGDVADGESGTT